MLEAFALEFAASPIATIAAIVSVIASVGGTIFAVLELARRRTRSAAAAEDDQTTQRMPDARPSTLTSVGIAACMIVTTPIGFALASKLGFSGSLFRGVFSVVLSYALCITLLAVVCGILLRNWIVENLTYTNDGDEVIMHIGGAPASNFQNAGYLIALVCVFMYWFVIGEDFNRFLQDAGLAKDLNADAAGYFFSYYGMIAVSIIVGIATFGVWASYLFVVYAKLHMLRIVVQASIDASKKKRKPRPD